MENTWIYTGAEPIKIKQYLSQLGMGHRMFNDLKHTGTILVDHRPVRPTTKVLPNQPLTIQFPAEPRDETVALSDLPFEKVYEDDNWIVVNKAVGEVSVPGPTQPNDTILNRVTGYLVAQQAPNQRPHLVTRLDRGTAGLMLVAKHNVATSMISQQVQQHTMEKYYYAVVNGTMPEQHGMIEAPILRVPDQAARVIDEAGQPARTEYWVLAEQNGYSLVKLRLHSGRTHQIRVHLSSLGHPLVGDHLYGGEPTADNHQLLQAVELAFTDPFTLERKEFKAPLLPEIEKFSS